ncbi:MAG: hypothetical protein R3F59_09910 [Myxococcota bacterium]
MPGVRLHTCDLGQGEREVCHGPDWCGQAPGDAACEQQYRYDDVQIPPSTSRAREFR